MSNHHVLISSRISSSVSAAGRRDCQTHAPTTTTKMTAQIQTMFHSPDLLQKCKRGSASKGLTMKRLVLLFTLLMGFGYIVPAGTASTCGH